MGLWQRNDRTKPKVGLQVKIYNSDAGIILKCADIIERMSIGFHLNEREQKPMLKADGAGEYRSIDPMLTLTVSALDHVRRILVAIRPWLFGGKATRADLMLKFLERRFAKFEDESMGKRAPYDAGDIRLVLQFVKNGKRGDLKAVERVLNELEQNAA